jgi:putative solute:sodium symporter small subunit
MAESIQDRVAHRRATMKVTLFLLLLWFLVSYGCAILFRDWLDVNMPTIGNAPFGFWMAQQGSIVSFVCILVVYAVWMNSLDSKYGFNQEGE